MSTIKVDSVETTDDTKNMRFSTNSTEAMRIDSSGTLLVGKTQNDFTLEGSIIRPAGEALFAREGHLLTLNRLTSDGVIVSFRKDATPVGSIGVEAGRLQVFRSSGAGLALFGSGWGPMKDGAQSDNQVDIAGPTNRIKDIWAVNGTIQTSDRNEKQQIAALTSAEMAAAKAISASFKTFKWNTSVEEKGDAARIHSGVIAQEVEQAMTDAGLDAGDYAFFSSNTWWETQTDVPAVKAVGAVEAQKAYTRTDTYNTAEEAPEGATERTRKGIRYPTLLAFVGAATEQRLSDIETRLAALESKA
jgi:hypothetical protein